MDPVTSTPSETKASAIWFSSWLPPERLELVRSSPTFIEQRNNFFLVLAFQATICFVAMVAVGIRDDSYVTFGVNLLFLIVDATCAYANARFLPAYVYMQVLFIFGAAAMLIITTIIVAIFATSEWYLLVANSKGVFDLIVAFLALRHYNRMIALVREYREKQFQSKYPAAYKPGVNPDISPPPPSPPSQLDTAASPVDPARYASAPSPS